MQGASLVVEALLKADVKHIFALSGNQIMPIFDACIDANIEIYHVRHEAAATYMADAYAQLTGGLGVALVTAALQVCERFISPLLREISRKSYPLTKW